jgi:hypothetical protein
MVGCCTRIEFSIATRRRVNPVVVAALLLRLSFKKGRANAVRIPINKIEIRITSVVTITADSPLFSTTNRA